MTEPGQLEAALAHLLMQLRRLGIPHALVGGLAVSIRGEVRFTRDVEMAGAVASDAAFESVVRDLAAVGYRVIAQVEHDQVDRLSIIRLRGRDGVVVDLLAASSGIEEEIVAAATPVTIDGAGDVPVARTEDLLVMKLLSMSDRRPTDRADALGLIHAAPDLDLDWVRRRLDLIRARGFDRHKDLDSRLRELVDDKNKP